MADFHIQDLSFTYPGASTAALEQVNLTVRQGGFLYSIRSTGIRSSLRSQPAEGSISEPPPPEGCGSRGSKSRSFHCI